MTTTQDDIKQRLEAITRSASKPKREPIRGLLRPDLIKLAAVTAMTTAAFFAGKFTDTVLFPVITDSHAIVSAKGTSTEVAFVFSKRRNCKLVSMDFFRQRGDVTELVAVEITPDQLRHRPVGRHISRSFVLPMTVAEFAETGSATLTHKCHPLWNHEVRLF